MAFSTSQLRSRYFVESTRQKGASGYPLCRTANYQWFARSPRNNGRTRGESRVALKPALVYTLAMRRYPLSFIILTTLGVLCLIPGAISLAGFGASLHPVLEDPMAGLAFIVSAIALIGSGIFPLVIEKLKESEER